MDKSIDEYYWNENNRVIIYMNVLEEIDSFYCHVARFYVRVTGKRRD
jgi:hypothetical protein